MQMQLADIEKKAKGLLNKLGIKTSPIPVEEIAKKSDISIQYAPLEDNTSGLLYSQNGKAVIGVNGIHSIVRQRFTIAHELGHYFLKHEGDFFLDRAILFRSERSKDINPDFEKEANAFAAALLMPEDMIVKELKKISDDEVYVDEAISILANKFNVSTQAMTIRLKTLELISF